MILTLTLNPSIDYLYTKKTFKLGSQNRFSAPIRMIGGKGINAGRTAAILGSDVNVTGILGGTNGQIVRDLLKKEIFDQRFFSVPGETRNAITIMHDQGIQTEIVEEGPLVNSQTESTILAHISTVYKNNPDISVICLSGSVNSANYSLYQSYIQHISQISQSKVKVLADISGPQLKNALLAKPSPFFIKPNIPEFSELIGKELTTKIDVLNQLNHPLIKDIPLLLITCGEDGAIAKFHHKTYDLTVPKIALINPTGSGDATVGGIAYGLDNNFTIEDTLRYGMASGVANAMEEAVGFVNKDIVLQLIKKISIDIIA